jgi:hypothetical protein
MFIIDAGIGNRHIVSGEGRHFGSEGLMFGGKGSIFHWLADSVAQKYRETVSYENTIKISCLIC